MSKCIPDACAITIIVSMAARFQCAFEAMQTLITFPGPLFHDQGLLIFLFHVVRHEKVYRKIKSKLPNLKV